MTHARTLQVYHQPRDAIRDHTCVLHSHCILHKLQGVLTPRFKGGLIPETDDFPKWGLLAQPQAAAAACGLPLEAAEAACFLTAILPDGKQIEASSAFLFTVVSPLPAPLNNMES